MSYSNTYAMGCLVVSSLGICLIFFIGGVMYGYRDTPIVKASGIEISSFLLLGLLLSFVSTFIIVSEPSEVNIDSIQIIFIKWNCPEFYRLPALIN